jgi:L-ascorbate metabolism protein UlaG (beta-lactamase superfamily)
MKKLIIKILKITGIIVLLFSLSVWLFLSFSPVFGDSPSGESLDKIKVSKNFNGEIFVNSITTQLDTRDPQSSQSMLTAFFNFIFPEDGKNPVIELPSAKFKNSALTNNSFVWFGHSTILMKTDNLSIITDPVFNNASPIPGTVKSFEIEYPIEITDLPEKIDVVLISHDHYDHLDYKAIQELDERVGQYFVPLGIKAHLLKWGIPEEKIKERDWYDVIIIQNTSFTMTPARHFSGRGMNNRFSTLWCSWVIKSPELNVFFNGDSGYFEEYKTIGEKFGPFDIAFMENGAYDKDWAEIHMLPEESVQANIDLKSDLMFPIHWGKFDLANHIWNEPIIRACKETELRNVKIATPLIGEVFTLENVPHSKWWILNDKINQ